ncbi:MAG: sulfur carrier protein ThiS adenylyltransferase ThiF [Clostridium sp.]|nr:sulfur carrier protein ThiS adenylyltransferase ThiF [Clostridium sp.]
MIIITKQELDKAMDSRFSKEIHQKLKSAKVAIAGLGGLGSNVAVMLARSGIGHLHLVDFDVVDVTNLNRQVYNIEHIGISKPEALKDIISKINPYLKITTENICVTEENAVSIFGEYEYVCEAFDKAENKAMLINTILSNCNNVKIVSGSGMAGYGSSNQIKTKKIMKNLYVCGDGVSDAIEGNIGLMSPRVSICAGHEANMIIRLILGINEE